MASDAQLQLSQNSRRHAQKLLTQFPVTNKERQELLPPTDRERNAPYLANDGRDLSRAMGKLNSGMPQVPPDPPYAPPSLGFDEIQAKRKELPIWNFRREIIQSIQHNQVTLITGDTGSGKTTQVCR